MDRQSEIIIFRVRVGKGEDFESAISRVHDAAQKTNWPLMGTGTSIQYEFHTPGERTITAAATELGFKTNKPQASIKVHTTNTAPTVWIETRREPFDLRDFTRR